MLKLHSSLLLLVCGAGLPIALTGCQTTVGGQTLPSPHYLRDDVQYFPAGPEFQHSNSVRAIEQYNLDKTGFQSDFGGDPGAPPQEGAGGGYEEPPVEGAMNN